MVILHQDILNILEVRGAILLEMGEVLDPITTRIIAYGDLLFYVIMIALFTTVLGIINVLFSAYVARKKERAVYYTTGMTKFHIRITGFLEILTVIFTSALLIPIFSTGMLYLIDISVNSFGVDLFFL